MQEQRSVKFEEQSNIIAGENPPKQENQAEAVKTPDSKSNPAPSDMGAALNAGTFFVPCNHEMAKLKSGDGCKIGIECKGGSERPWVEIETVNGDCFTGRIFTLPLFTDIHGLGQHDLVEFQSKNVLEIAEKELKRIDEEIEREADRQEGGTLS